MSSPPAAMSMGVYHSLQASSPRTLHEQARSPTHITHMDHYQVGTLHMKYDNVSPSSERRVRIYYFVWKV